MTTHSPRAPPLHSSVPAGNPSISGMITGGRQARRCRTYKLHRAPERVIISMTSDSRNVAARALGGPRQLQRYLGIRNPLCGRQGYRNPNFVHHNGGYFHDSPSRAGCGDGDASGHVLSVGRTRPLMPNSGRRAFAYLCAELHVSDGREHRWVHLVILVQDAPNADSARQVISYQWRAAACRSSSSAYLGCPRRMLRIDRSLTPGNRSKGAVCKTVGYYAKGSRRPDMPDMLRCRIRP